MTSQETKSTPGSRNNSKTASMVDRPPDLRPDRERKGGEWVTLYGYKYDTNEEQGTRAFWKQFERNVNYYDDCPHGLSSWFNWGQKKCYVPDIDDWWPTRRFLGEECEDKHDCYHDITKGHVDMTCNND